MPAPDKIKQPVETFEHHLAKYRTVKNLASAKTPQERERRERVIMK